MEKRLVATRETAYRSETDRAAEFNDNELNELNELFNNHRLNG